MSVRDRNRIAESDLGGIGWASEKKESIQADVTRLGQALAALP